MPASIPAAAPKQPVRFHCANQQCGKLPAASLDSPPIYPDYNVRCPFCDRISVVHVPHQTSAATISTVPPVNQPSHPSSNIAPHPLAPALIPSTSSNGCASAGGSAPAPVPAGTPASSSATAPLPASAHAPAASSVPMASAACNGSAGCESGGIISIGRTLDWKDASDANLKRAQQNGHFVDLCNEEPAQEIKSFSLHKDGFAFVRAKGGGLSSAGPPRRKRVRCAASASSSASAATANGGAVPNKRPRVAAATAGGAGNASASANPSASAQASAAATATATTNQSSDSATADAGSRMHILDIHQAQFNQRRRRQYEEARRSPNDDASLP